MTEAAKEPKQEQKSERQIVAGIIAFDYRDGVEQKARNIGYCKNYFTTDRETSLNKYNLGVTILKSFKL